MPRRAKTDTYATENVYEVPVRRFVRAGDVVPASWEVDAADVEDDDADNADLSRTPEVEDVEVEQPKHRKRSK